MGIFLGLAAALSWGTADFLGGVFSRRHHVLSVSVISQSSSLLILILLIGVFRPEIRTETVAWGLAAGVFTSLGAVALYQGLATGDSAVVAPLSACGAVVPVVFSFAAGDAPGPLQTFGIALALIGTVVVSLPGESVRFADSHHLRPLLFGFAAAVGFGVFFVLIDQGVSRDSDTFVVTGAARFSGALLVGAIAIVARAPFRPANDAPRIAAMGVFDLAANGAFALASNRGNLAVSSVLASLYPVQTLLLARFATAERFTGTRILGAALALGGVAAISAG